MMSFCALSIPSLVCVCGHRALSDKEPTGCKAQRVKVKINNPYLVVFISHLAIAHRASQIFAERHVV